MTAGSMGRTRPISRYVLTSECFNSEREVNEEDEHHIQLERRQPELFYLAHFPIWSCALYSYLNPERSIAEAPLRSKF